MIVTIYTCTGDEEVKRSWADEIGARSCEPRFGDPGDCLRDAGLQLSHSNFLIDGYDLYTMPMAGRAVIRLHRLIWPPYWRPRIVLLANDHDFPFFARFERMSNTLVHCGNESMDAAYDFVTGRGEVVMHDAKHIEVVIESIRVSGVLAI